jgi:hypothetical protein
VGQDLESVVISQAKPPEGIVPANLEGADQSVSGNPVDLGYQPDAQSVLGPLTKRTVLLIGVGCLPLLVAFLWNLWSKPAFRFYPVALVAGLWLMRRGWRTLRADLRPGSAPIVLGWLGFAFAALLVATIMWTPWGGAVGTLLALVGLIWWLGGWPLLRALLPGLLMLVIVVRPPLGMGMSLLEALGTKLLRAASRMLYEMSVPHFISGTAVELPGFRLPFSEVTTLTNIIPSVIAFSLLYALWRRRSVVRVVLGLVVAPAFPVLLLSVAIIAGIRLSLADNFDVFAGMRGVAIQAGVFLVSAGFVVSFDEFLTFLFAPVLRSRSRPDAELVREIAGPKLFPAGAGSRRAAMLGLAFAVLGVGQLVLGGLFYTRLMELNQPVISRLSPQGSFSLPTQIGEWKQVDEAPVYVPDLPVEPTKLKAWYFETANLAAVVTLEYPQRGFVNPVSQYKATGWTVWRETPRGGGTADAPSGMEVEMQRNWVQVGTLWVGACDEAGRWQPMPGTKPVLFERFKPQVREPVVARIQLLSCGREAMAAEDGTKVAELFQTVGRDLNAQIKSQLKTP